MPEAEPVTCLGCKNSAVRHSDDAGCLRQRCECARGDAEELDAHDEEDAFEVLHMPEKKKRASQAADRPAGAPQQVRLQEILEDAPQEDGDERRREAPDQQQPEEQQNEGEQQEQHPGEENPPGLDPRQAVQMNEGYQPLPSAPQLPAQPARSGVLQRVGQAVRGVAREVAQKYYEKEFGRSCATRWRRRSCRHRSCRS